ncbi:hypothetical protein [Rhizorhapis sp. SPR117]|uniref:hypothetical protein n=1 Tax=Rhizorhapis sp. SPR117 TaxID=2912611 RepID=UPI001F2F82E1|nr:hypothetical protein [Rhizorhapis sp. SPR117]
MVKLADFKRPPKSVGNYLCLADAATMIGAKIASGWRNADLIELSDPTGDAEAQERATIVRQRLTALLAGGMLPAFGRNHEGRYIELGRERLSAPFFAINIPRSEFLWTEEEWDLIFVSRSDLKRYVDSLRNSKPRKSVTFDWQEITTLAWRLALDNPHLRKPAKLIDEVQSQYALKYDQHPDAKELRDLVNEIIAHLGDRVLSRDISSPETSCDAPPKSP